jgi:hypothetical protein
VKTLCADGSVAASHARVGHCQAPKWKSPLKSKGFKGFFLLRKPKVKSKHGHLFQAPKELTARIMILLL